jgi:hypothetical protein
VLYFDQDRARSRYQVSKEGVVNLAILNVIQSSNSGGITVFLSRDESVQ